MLFDQVFFAVAHRLASQIFYFAEDHAEDSLEFCAKHVSQMVRSACMQVLCMPPWDCAHRGSSAALMRASYLVAACNRALPEGFAFSLGLLVIRSGSCSSFYPTLMDAPHAVEINGSNKLLVPVMHLRNSDTKPSARIRIAKVQDVIDGAACFAS